MAYLNVSLVFSLKLILANPGESITSKLLVNSNLIKSLVVFVL